MGRYPTLFFSKYKKSKQWVTFFVLVVNIFAQFSFLEFLIPKLALAAVVTVDASVSTIAAQQLHAGSQSVFVSDQVGYKFYVDSTGVCAYSKTTNGGGSWSSAVTVNSQTDCISIVVWYDRFTPGSTGKSIHISTMDTSSNALWYNRLDTTNDTLLLGSSPVNVTSNSGQAATFANGVNEQSISVDTSGAVYMAVSDASDSYVVFCSASCGTGTNWNEAGSLFMDLANDWNLLEPLSGGSMMLINRSLSLDDIRSRIWNGSSWSGSWVTLESNAPENSTYDVGMSAVVEPSSNDIYLAYAADNDNFTVQDHDIRTAKYSGGTWTSKTDVFTNNATKGLTNVAIALDTNTLNIYVAYSARTTPATGTTGNIYYATSTSAMSVWSSEQGPVNSAAADIYGLDLNPLSDERIYATWEDPNPKSIFGNTMADLTPTFVVTSLGTSTTNLIASSSNQYLGGQFVFKENVASRNVTNVTINESGTIDAQNNVKNIKLLYDLDTSAPYDCVSESFAGSESQFGSTVSGGFNNINGSSTFSDLVNVSPSKTLCLYVVVDVLDSAKDGDTIKVSINNPVTDVLVSGGITAVPQAPVEFSNTTLVLNDNLKQIHYHWRNDNGSETTATSFTGQEDTPIPALLKNTPKRLRVEVSNKGSVSSAATRFRLEYGTAAPTCSAITNWTDIATTTGMWRLFDSSNFVDGNDTTNIATSTGGTTDDNPSFLTPNGGLKDISSQTGALTLSTTNFTELEYSILASTSSVEGDTYCFRVTDAGNPLPTYTVYPAATVSSDITASALGTQPGILIAPSTNNYLGGTIVLKENTSNHNVTSITVTETGTINASTSLNNTRLLYDLDTTAPYDCVSESYNGSEAQFGATSTGGFSGPNGSSTFTGSVNITTTKAMCVYVLTDVNSSAVNNETLNIGLFRGGDDVAATLASISPSTPIFVNGTTTIAGAIIVQTGYHFRNDDGTEATSTSATLGVENTIFYDQPASTSIRLRLGLNNAGTATSSANTYRLEYGTKISTCSAISNWIGVGDTNDDWNMYNSANLSDGNNTTNISTSTGGVSDSNTTFLTANNGVKDTSGTTSAITLNSTQFTELEFSITTTQLTAYNTFYCFRLTSGGVPLGQYTNYPEVRSAPKRDFKIQRGNSTVSGNSLTLVAGVDYVAPASSSTAFVRITNLANTGAGKNSAGGSQNSSDVTAYISNPGNIVTNFVITRPTGAANNTRVSWEIIEFIGSPGTDNEIKVRSVGTVSPSSGVLTATGTAVSGVVDDTDVVVFITGVENQDTSRNLYYAGQFTSAWNSTLKRPIFTRGATGASADVSYAVVEFTGINWNVQRIEHAYTASGTVETESMTPVNSLARTFIHDQKRMTAQSNVNNFGHEVWLSSIGAVSFQLEPGATSPSGHTSVAWVIENQQTSAGAMKVQRDNRNTTDGAEPVSLVVNLLTNVSSLNNTSISGNGRVTGANSAFPLPLAGLSLTSTSTYTLWRSEATAGLLSFRTEIIEWPVTGLAVRQNYYRIYVDSNSIKPSDPWPLGAVDLGENTALTASDEPPGGGENLRLRMSLKVTNATLPAGLYDFKLQYGLRATPSCTAVSSWTDLGQSGSAAIWRGVNATGTTGGANLSINPPNGGDLLITQSDTAGSFVEENPSPALPYSVSAGDDVEYDWLIQNNGALEKSFYCFRMVQGDSTPLDGYLYYPQIRTAGFTPVTQNWRFYDDTNLETPLTPLAAENVAPIEVQYDNNIALRTTVWDSKNVIGTDVKFKLQYDESPSFTNPRDVSSQSNCSATSTWCYGSASSSDNAKITTKLLSDADSCSSSIGSGCGTHNLSPTYATGTNHVAGAKSEYAFYLKHPAARVGVVYYFRLYDVVNNLPVPIKSGYTSPSLISETSKLSMSIAGLPIGTNTSGITTTASSTASTISFGIIPIDTDWYAGHRIAVDTNATEGYRVLSYARQQLLNNYGTAINSITGTNQSPTPWAIGCTATSTGCIGYHTTDATLSGGSTRFSPLDSYAGLETSPQEVMYSSVPASDVHDIVYRVKIKVTQPANNYQTEIVYLAVPTY